MNTRGIIFLLALFFCGFAYGATAVNVDLYAAKEDAQKDNKLVMLVITRPSTCGLCVAFKKNVLDNSSFKGFAKKNLIVVTIEFGEDRTYIVKENKEAQDKARREFSQKYTDYRLLPGVFIIDPKTDKDIFVQSPEVANLKAQEFIRKIKDFQRDLKKQSEEK